jgi:hypothetical protein
MKKSLLLPILALLLITACEKEQSITTETQPAKVETEQDLKSVPTPPADVTVEDRSSNDVTICHYSEEDGSWHVIEVNANALPAHLAHGDVQLVDADGDGWVAAENECVPGGDCDDTNAAINPDATEVPGNGLDDDCDPNTLDGCPVIQGLLLVTLPDGSCLYVAPEDQKTGTPQFASDGVEWGGFGTDINNPTNLVNITTPEDALLGFAGAANTAAIVEQLGAGNYAAKVCEELNAYGYDDWYLPALGELKAVYDEHGGTGQNYFNVIIIGVLLSTLTSEPGSRISLMATSSAAVRTAAMRKNSSIPVVGVSGDKPLTIYMSKRRARRHHLPAGFFSARSASGAETKQNGWRLHAAPGIPARRNG